MLVWLLVRIIMYCLLSLIAVLCIRVANGEPNVYLWERFDDGDAWKDRWVQSNYSPIYGQFKLSHGKFFADPKADMGIQTADDARFYALSRKLDKVFDNTNKTFVLQYSVKNEQDIDCGGAYIKVLSADTDLNSFNKATPYYIMFGPDLCSHVVKKVQVIFGYKGKNLEMEKEIRCEDDDLTHVYTLMLFPNLTYKVSIDLQVVQEGYLEDDWRFLVDKVIRDPTAKKPDNWDMREMIFDENDTKPEDWDKPETILDPNAVKPDNWNDEMDGEWQPPEIPNPEYKGKWKRRLIKNPNYHGPWRAPFIQNPDYVPDAYLVSHHDIGAVGFEIWQVKSGTIFDNILITDDPVFAEKVGNNTWRKSLDLERLRRDEYVDIEKKRQQGAEESNKQQGEALSGASERKHDGKGSKAIAMEEL